MLLCSSHVDPVQCRLDDGSMGGGATYLKKSSNLNFFYFTHSGRLTTAAVGGRGLTGWAKRSVEAYG